MMRILFKRKEILLLLVIAISYLGCDTKNEVEADIEQINVDFELIRFDKIFGSASASDLPALKQNYPLFFPKMYHDSVWQAKMGDTLQIELNQAVLEVFPSEEKLEDELHALFQHIYYYFPEFKIPTVYTTTSDVDYRTRIIATDSILIIELDTYLGSDHPFYQGISKYIVKNMRPGMIAQDVATAYSKRFIEVPRTRRLLDQMVYFGKQLYLKDLWVPRTHDHEKIGYSEAELQWALDNEQYIWRHFVENELIYSNEPKLSGRFIDPAPFSKFNLEIDNESPGMVGRFIGWMIVRSYVKNNDVSLDQLMRMSPDELYKNSKYKPRK